MIKKFAIIAYKLCTAAPFSHILLFSFYIIYLGAFLYYNIISLSLSWLIFLFYYNYLISPPNVNVNVNVNVNLFYYNYLLYVFPLNWYLPAYIFHFMLCSLTVLASTIIFGDYPILILSFITHSLPEPISCAGDICIPFIFDCYILWFTVILHAGYTGTSSQRTKSYSLSTR